MDLSKELGIKNKMEKTKCPFCEKVIEGFTKEQAEYLLKQHILSKHPDKLMIATV